ncbi:MAG: hypothetical protein QF483_07885 [Gammaproteobacteria bacterium]|jgi:hypothetical protein|nr:hypothetical protein [Chromatiales bacterium]MCP4925694.1 hypothetical protein [Gammaproteobacteria bacterium]MDP7297470.1 hypothetical protein [Gammaproteobacteria bacterium]MDP7419788.1 hypothetical protein [Gammaproteobacteria bacterium]MDP7660151.1 hypothetical protein [Gammaproteobacteria bacterium]
MSRARPAFIQVSAAVIVLLLGILVYLLDRPDASVYLIPTGWTFGTGLPPVFGGAGDYLPTFAHTFAFALFTSALLEPWRWSGVTACMGWWVVGSLFEVAQSDALAAGIAERVPGWFADWPLLDNVAGYFMAGHFDFLDLVSIGIGAVSALAVIRLSRSRRTGRAWE